MLNDLRDAWRSLLSGRRFTAVAVTCLALGIATNTTLFSVFNAIFLRPLPFPEPDRLVSLSGRHAQSGRRVSLTLEDARELGASQSLENVAAYSGRAMTLNDVGEPERVAVQLVTANLFKLLGKQPQLGRAFEETDDRFGAAGVAVISDSLWRRRYQQDPATIGRVFRLDDVQYTIAGVMPPNFKFPSTSEVWTPIVPAIGTQGSASRGVSVIARLTPSATLDGANAELGAHGLRPSTSSGQAPSTSSGQAPSTSSGQGRTAVARKYGDVVVGTEERTITSALMGATTVLLVLACVNLANLMLARGAGRRREFAVRAALGASRARIIRQLLVESVLLAAIAAAVALPLAWYGIRWVHDAVPPTDPLGPYYIDWSLDATTLLYAAGITLMTAFAFGLAPAFDAAGRRLLNPLREGAGSASGHVQRRVHDALIVVQVALALVLLVGASLFVRTYAGLRTVELGYDTSHLMTMRFYLAGAAYGSEESRARAVDEIARSLEGLPGAHAATVTDLVPLDDQGGSDAAAEVDGRTFEEGREPTVHYAGVAGRWPETFGLTVLAGRSFIDRELQSGAAVALVNSKLARTFWPGESPLGRRFRFADEPSMPWFTVIGVVPDIRTVKLDESRATPPTAYVPHRFIPTRNYGIVVRTRANPESVTGAVRRAVHDVDAGIALFDVYSMEQVRWLSYWMYVMWGTMFGVFGLIALLIAAVGVYGIVFYTVAQRTREIGLRVALGAQRGQVVSPILKQVAILSTFGLVIGAVGALAVAPLVASLLIGVPPGDATGLLSVSVILTGVALAATWLPAWRASAVDPAIALRDH